MNNSKHNGKVWDEFYKKSSKFIFWPSEDIFAFTEKYLKDLTGKNVLDIGCGAGRHLVIFDHISLTTC